MSSNSLDRLLVMAIALLFAQTSGSGSSVARVFWISIPSVMLETCCIFAVPGLWAKIGLVLLISIISIPETICRINDKR